MPTKTIQTQVMMTAAEARTEADAVKREIAAGNELFESANTRVARIRNRQGHLALGYANFTEFIEQDLGLKKSQGYRLADAGAICLRLGQHLPESHARALNHVPEERQAEVLLLAESTAGDEPVTAKDIEAAAAATGAVEPKPESASTSKGGSSSKGSSSSRTSSRDPGHPNWKDDDKLSHAIERIHKLCEVPSLRKALIDGTIDLSKQSIIQWAEQDDDMVRQMERLISVNRWSPGEAIKFLNDMPDSQSRFEELKNRALAAGGAYEAVIGSFGVLVLTPETVKKHWKAVLKLVGADWSVKVGK